MTDTVAGRAFQQDRILQLALLGSSFQDDVLHAILHAHDLAAETHH